MTDSELIEYAVYHWVFGKDYKLPGLNANGSVAHDFFERYPAKSDYQAFSDQFSLIKNDQCLKDADSLMLCSGGVDSSLLAYFRSHNLNSRPQSFIHTSYVNHNKNDLQKFINVLELCPSIAFVCSIDQAEYIAGIELLSKNNFYQNTYAPTLAYALGTLKEYRFTSVITGSGPDELFYGMEKYSWDIFEKLSDEPIAKALEKLDPRYNLAAYARLFNSKGQDLYGEVVRKRRALYESIADLRMNIFDSQRVLAYATVTAQHMQLFNKLADIFHLEHRAPYLNEQLVHLALTTPLVELVDIGVDKRVEIGKKYLKTYLLQYFSRDHVHGKKIGFHAPTTQFVYEYSKSFLLNNIDYLPCWLDKDKVLRELDCRFNEIGPPTDYFLYSLVNVIKYRMENSNDY